MKRHSPSCTRSTRGIQYVVAVAAVTGMLSLGTAGGAQTRSARDTATAYGARLNAKGEPANLNPNRINNRVNNRLDTRLSLRIERYRPDSTNDPAAAFAVRPTDNARVGTETTLSPPATSTSTTVSQGYEGTAPSATGQTIDASHPR